MTTPDISDDPARLQLDVIHDFLANTYWSAGIPREVVARAVANSHCVGAYAGGTQIGFARVITDHATFAYLADVFVIESARGHGIARAMVAFLQDHPRLQHLRRWLLATRDAHDLYARLGWAPLAEPHLFMQRHFPDVYRP